MKPKQHKSYRGLFFYKSLRLQLLARSLFILAGLLALIGLLQYVLMQEAIYKNKADSLQSAILSISSDTWEQIATSSSNGTTAPYSARIFVPEARLAFIDLQGNYSVLFKGFSNIEPPRLEPEEYQQILNYKPNRLGTNSGRPDKSSALG
jgi:two-component system OmpR family sensor kinase